MNTQRTGRISDRFTYFIWVYRLFQNVSDTAEEQAVVKIPLESRLLGYPIYGFTVEPRQTPNTG